MEVFFSNFLEIPCITGVAKLFRVKCQILPIKVLKAFYALKRMYYFISKDKNKVTDL